MSANRDSSHTDVVRIAADNQWDGIDDFDNFLTGAAALYGDVVIASDELGDGFMILENKDRLIGVPMVCLDWKFISSDKYKNDDGSNSHFVSVRVAAKMDGGHTVKYRVNDGSTGICKQLWDYSQVSGRLGGLVVNAGLTRSDYTNEFGEGTTYYLSTSA